MITDVCLEINFSVLFYILNYTHVTTYWMKYLVNFPLWNIKRQFLVIQKTLTMEEKNDMTSLAISF